MKWGLIFCSFFIFFISAFSSCDLSMFANNRSRQYSIVSPEDEISQIPTSEYFFITLKSAYYTGGQGSFDPLDFLLYAMDDGPGTQCKISVEEESSTEDLFCMLDVMEGDLWYHEINLEYNFPPEMCAYAGFYPHWHFNQKIGRGPDKVYACNSNETQGDQNNIVKKYTVPKPPNPTYCFEETRPDNSPADTEWGSKTLVAPKTICENKTDCGADNVVGADQKRFFCEIEETPECPVAKGKTYVKNDIKDLCPEYDKSGEDSDLANCCLGEYTVEGGDGENTGKWGGDVKNCIGGLARMNWNEGEGFDDDGYPVTIVEESGSKGVNKDYTLHPLIQKVKKRYSLPTANFFKDIENDKETSEFPPFYSTPADSGIDRQGHPFLTWTCFDHSREVKHRIHLLIREWNTQEEFIRFKESNGSRGDPDTGGIDGKEGSVCEYFEKKTPIFDDCNDLRDADDPIGKVYPEIQYE